MRVLRLVCFLVAMCCLASCGFTLRGPMPLSPALQNIYLQTPDPYGQLAKYIRQYLKTSHVHLAANTKDATSVLVIIREETGQNLLGVNITQQTRQYNLTLTVTFQIEDPRGHTLVPSQSLTETRTLTINSDQILANSNEATNLYQQMRQAISYDILSRLASNDVTALLTKKS